jgi:hypothetical protein
MAKTRFQVTTEGAQFADGEGNILFRTAFSRTSGGSTKYFNQRHCPVITIVASDVLQTEDDWATGNLEKMGVPNRTLRGGVRKDPGLMFDDVTATTTEEDVTVDLDTIFNQVP